MKTAAWFRSPSHHMWESMSVICCCQANFAPWPLGATCAWHSRRRRGLRWRSRWWRRWSAGRTASSAGRTPPDPLCPKDSDWPLSHPPSPENTTHTHTHTHCHTRVLSTRCAMIRGCLTHTPGCYSCQTPLGYTLSGKLRWCRRWGGRSSPRRHRPPPHTLHSAWPVSLSNLRTHRNRQTMMGLVLNPELLWRPHKLTNKACKALSKALAICPSASWLL